MSNNLILDLTVRLTQALDQNYDVVNMDTVLAVISALEGATITKEQLETTRLAKHINQLRRRNKSNTLAIRAKNLLKKWREMFGITSLVQSEVTSSVTLQAQPTQQQAPKPPISSTSQPASPYTAQLLGENFDNSLSSIGGGVEFNSRAATGGGVSNTGSANFTFNKKSGTGAAAEANGTISSRSNGALTDTQTRLIKSTNRSIINNNSPSLPAVATGTKVKHPTSFKNLISGFSIQKQSNSSVLSPILKVPPASSVGEADENHLKSNSTTYIIDDDDNQSQPSTTGVALTGVSSPRTHKSTKRKDRDSPLTMAFNIEHSNSPLDFENVSSHETGRDSQTIRHNNVNQIITSTIDLPDSNSSSNFVSSLGEVADIHTANSSGRIGLASSNSNNSKRIRKDKKRSNERVDLVTESEHFQPTIDETSRIAFPISGIQEYLSLSNSSMSIFPSQQAAGSGATERYPNNTGGNDDNQPLCSSIEVVDGDLTFAGKFKQSNSSSGIEVGSSSNSNYFSNGGENTSVKSGEFACGNMNTAINNCRDSLSAGGIASATFLPFSRNSNESTSNSRTSQLDLIDVVNQDSQSMTTVDDLRQQQQSSNEKIKTQGDGESAQAKYIKENSSSSKQCSKDLPKAASAQKPINAANSKPTTPTLTTNAAICVTSPPVEQKVPKKRGRKKGSKGVDSVLAQSACLSSQFLMSPALGSNKKVKTTMELIADIQNRKIGSATSSPTLMNWFATSRPASSCSEPSLHSPRTSDACSTNATMSTAARSTPEKNVSSNSAAADELYESDSDSNTSEPSHDSVKMPMTNDVLTNSQSKPVGNEASCADGVSAPTSTIEEQIKELMAQLPPIDEEKIDWDAYEDIPCTCTLREVPPEVDPPSTEAADAEEENKTSLGLLENVEDIKIKENYGDEPIISVSVLPLAAEKPKPAKVWSPMAPHSQSAPVSAVTSPVVPSTNQKPMKSIFDLDFDEDNDPLHSFVEAASKTKTQSSSIPENGKVQKAETSSTILTTPNDHSDVVITEEMQESTSQSEPMEEPSSVEPPAQQLQATPLEGSDPMMMPPVMNFPTYEVVEDSECEAKQRYEVQTNQITKFHIDAFHNCFIPNVNGNWDHSIPQNTDDENRLLEDDSLSANVVPKYGCFINERIPKDLSHVKFTKDFKPKSTKKSDKPPSPFLGVANIHRRQHFRLHHQQRLKRKAALRKKSKQLKLGSAKSEHKTEIKQENIKIELDSVPEPDAVPNAASHPNIPEPTVPTEAMAVDSDCDIKCIPVKAEKEIQSEEKPCPTPTPTRTPTPTPTPTILPEVNLKSTKNPIDDHQQCTTVHKNNLNQHIAPSIAGNMDFKPERKNGAIELDQENIITQEPITDLRKPPLANGNLHHHLTNNNSILHCSDENKSDISGSTKVLHNCNHNILIDGVTEEGIAASRRSSSCSNSSLKQNQNSINMRLRRHRLEQQQLEKQKQLRKRKHLSSFTEIFDFEPDEAHEQSKVPPLLKRIKLVNGEYASARRLTSSITDDDGDSDCYHGHSENDIITEEEIDDDDQVEDEFEDMVDEYDEDDGDDEEDAEEDYGDFHEVVTRDMASTTGNNHIVLTIKKTPSKTNSPSSSSMSPALNVNHKLSSISPTTQSTVDTLLLEENAIELSTISPAIQSTVDALLLEDNTIELPTDPNESAYRVTLDKFLELGTVKTVDLIGKTDFFIPETSDVAIYSFEVKKNGDNDHGNDGDDDENDRPEEIVQPSDETDRPSEAAENAETAAKSEEPEKTEKDTATKPVVKLSNFNKITKSELSESIQLTKKQLRRKELKTHLQQGIREAQKLHRRLFFPYELHPTVGQKILEISSCTSDCTDPSEEETDDDDDEGDSGSSDSGTSHGTTSSSDGLATGMKLRRRRKVKLRAKRQRGAGGGGGPPSSSSSSSSSSSDSSSSSSSAFTSLSTTSSSSSEDENRKPKKRKPLPPAEKKEETKEEPSSSSDNKPKEGERELPAQNNFLLRSFNHIYVSTEERRRQEQLKWAAEYRNTQIMNTGYTALTADNPDNDDIPSGSMPEFASTSNSSVYYNSYYNNPNRNIYPGSNNSAGFNSIVYTPGTSFASYPGGYTTNTQLPTIATPSLLYPSQLQTQSQSQAQAQAESSTIVEPASSTEAVATEEQTTVTETSSAESSAVINSARDEATTNIGETSEIEPSTSAGEPTHNDSNYRINPDSSIGSNNNNNNNNDNINNNNSSVQLDEGSEQDLVAHEEYRTGLRKVDEDVDDEDGNDCARTQQFKEWHEVLQLRSYNDELLTVLPYVVIE